MDKDNIALEKSYRFALRIVPLYRKLTDEKHEYVLSKALLNDGTNIGAYLESAQEAESRDGFIREISLALQRAARTKFWLNVLHDGGFLTAADYEPVYEDCLELKRLLGSIIKTSRGR